MNIVNSFQKKIFILLLICNQHYNAFTKQVAIGGLFTEHQLEELLVFCMAVDELQFQFQSNKNTIVPLVHLVSSFNSFEVNTKACHFLKTGVVAIFGPIDEISWMQVKSICEHFQVPHIEARETFDFDSRHNLTINLYPQAPVFSSALMDVIDNWGWKKFAIIYENSEDIVFFKNFFKVANIKNYEIEMYQLLPDRPYRNILQKLKNSKVNNIVLYIKTDHLTQVLRQALQVNILSEKYNFLIASLDLHTLDMTDYRFSKANITSFRIVQDNHPRLLSLKKNWNEYSTKYLRPLGKHLKTPLYLKSQSALIYDSIYVLAKVLKQLQVNDLPKTNCENSKPWKLGSSIVNYSRQMQIEGFTGFVNFDKHGFRKDISFDILSTTESHFEVIGTWKQHIGFKKTTKWKYINKTKLNLIRVTTLLNDPFIMNKNSTKELKGNDRYEGYIVDLLTEINKLLNFHFEIQINLVEDGQYGAINSKTHKWNGMIGEVLSGKADIAVADLTINSDRELAVDFTHPFMTTGISIVYKKPLTKEFSFWSFLSPFTPTVWLYLITTFASISLVLFYVGRFTPYEWTFRNACRHHQHSLQNDFSIQNSFWAMIGSLMLQGSNITPKALSTRLIISSWYFFTLIIVSSYTANLAAFLTVENTRFPFETIEELVKQKDISYGCLANGSTHKFFSNSNIATYKTIGNFMNAHPELLVTSNVAGAEKVNNENGKYAFFMESATTEYMTERFCSLTQIGGLLDHKGYGVAIKKNSKLRNQLSETILKLQETGVLQSLKDRWWKQKGGGQCSAKPQTLVKLNILNLGGVFVVLATGTVFAVSITIGEYLFYFYSKRSNTSNASYKTQLLKNILFALSCWKKNKIVKQKRETKVLLLPKSVSNSIATKNILAYNAIQKKQGLAILALRSNSELSEMF